MTFVIFVFVMAGVTKDNQGFLSAEKLSLIKKDSFFILMSRAAVVDFDALCGLTEEGRFTVAADVFPEEPIPRNHRIRKNENILLSHHWAGGIPQAFARIGEMVIDDLSLILCGLLPAAYADCNERNSQKLGKQKNSWSGIVF